MEKNYNHPINIIFGRWEEVYETLSKFDCMFFDDYDIKTLELCKLDSTTPCRNIDFIVKLKNHLKKHTKFSFYCATNKEQMQKYKNQWEKSLKGYQKNINFEEYVVNVPKNCRYIVDQTLYCSLVEFKKIFDYQ